MGTTVGVAPGFLLLPAREYEWELKKKVEFRIPLKGSIRGVLREDVLSGDVKIAGDDGFSIFEDNVLLLWEIVRVMFASARYPELESNECFNVVALEFEDDEVIIYGEVIKSVE